MIGYSHAKDQLETNMRKAARTIEFFNDCRFIIFSLSPTNPFGGAIALPQLVSYFIF